MKYIYSAACIDWVHQNAQNLKLVLKFVITQFIPLLCDGCPWLTSGIRALCSVLKLNRLELKILI